MGFLACLQVSDPVYFTLPNQLISASLPASRNEEEKKKNMPTLCSSFDTSNPCAVSLWLSCGKDGKTETVQSTDWQQQKKHTASLNTVV